MRDRKNRVEYLGVTGEMGAGKDTFCQFLKDQYSNVFVFRFSDILTEILKFFFNSIKREDQQWLGKLLKERFGGDILVKSLIRKSKQIPGGLVVFNGVRSEEEERAIRLNNGKIIYITAKRRLRWERIQKRGEKEDDKASYQKFLEMEKAPTELSIPLIGKRADFKLENNYSKRNLFKKIKELISKNYGKKLLPRKVCCNRRD